MPNMTPPKNILKVPFYSWPGYLIILVLFVIFPLFILSTTMLIGNYIVNPPPTGATDLTDYPKNMADSGEILENGKSTTPGHCSYAGRETGTDPADTGSLQKDFRSARTYILNLRRHLENLPENLKTLQPNELGEIMILMYHDVGWPEKEFRRSPENFRRDMETLYREGYRPVNLLQVLEGNIDIPYLTTPVVLTFDDATAGQFRFIEKDGKMIVDPDSAVGILMEFNQKYPDFMLAATFYVYFEMPFRQPDYVGEKLRFLQEKGFEIGNHTMDHPNLARLSPENVQRQLALPFQEMKKYIPGGYDLATIALPFGINPRQRELAIKGSYAGIRYHHRAVLLAGANPAHSPFHTAFSIHLPRIKASEIRTDNMGLQDWLQYFRDNPQRRYLSDGNPHVVTISTEKLEYINDTVVGERRVITY